MVVVAAVLALPLVLTVRLLTSSSEDLPVIAGASVLVSVLALLRGGEPGGRRRDRADRIALTQLVAAFTVFALLPLGLLAESSLRLSQRAVESDARASVRTTSTVSAELVQQRLNGLGQVVESYAQRQLLLGALGDGTLESYDDAAIRRHLGQLQALDPGLAAVFVADSTGRLGVVLPETPEIIGRDFSARDWFIGGTATAGAYVSEAYQTAITWQARVVAVAVAVRRPATGDIAGYLVATYDLDAIQAFSERLAGVQGVTLRITDQRGTIVASPGSDADDLVDVSGDAGVAAALRGQAGLDVAELDGAEVLSAYAPVPDLGWTVTAQIPTATAYASLAPLRSTVLGIAVLLGQVLLAGLVLMARSQRRQREVERELVEREESTRAILDAAADAFVSIDLDGAVTSWSAQSEALFGWTAEQAAGRPLVDLIAAPAVRSRFLDRVRRLSEPSEQGNLLGRVELAARHRDGRRFPVELVIWRSVRGGRVSFNSFLHDISSRKRHEAELARARDEALEAARAKTEFLAVMSHELRTPLNGVMGMTSLLLSTPLSPRQLEYAQTVRSSADGLLSLLNDILDLSKVEADRMELEELDFDLHPVVRDVVHLLAVSAKEKGLTLEADLDADVPLDLRGDPARLRQVLLNLVGNAVKFTSTGSVHLRVSLDRSAGAAARAGDDVRLRFDVCDTGIGIPAEARRRLFLPSSQADASTTRRHGGTGLGLAISKSLVELLDGDIGVDSEPGTGATFWFTAGFRAGEPVQPGAEPAALEPLRRAAPGLVLVVDDNATNQRIAVRMLETLGHRADVAASGVEAVEACARVPYDLVLMDCRMPIMDGYEATLAIREAEGERRRTPIVAMTASAMPEDRQHCLRVGMDDYVSKPVRLAEVAAKVDHWMPEVSVPVRMARAEATTAPVAVVAQPVPLDGPVLDEKVVAGLRELGQDFLAQLVPVFVGSVSQRHDDITGAARAGDARALAEVAHVLRGSAGNLGGLRVASVCGRLEEAANVGSWDRTAADLLALEAELPALLRSVTALAPATT